MDQEYRSLKSFLIKECSVALNPADPSDTRTFGHIEELVEAMILFLKWKPSSLELEDVGSKALGAISIYSSSNLDIEKLSGAIESLSTGFESFLKKIAEVKFGRNSTMFRGDGVIYSGFIGTTLGKLLQGEVAKVNQNMSGTSKLIGPIVTFSYNSPLLRDQVYNYIRTLRNQVHISPSRTISECIANFKTCVSAYLLATEENISIIRQASDPIFIYLASVKKKFHALNSLFVDIESEAANDSSIDLPDLDVIELFSEETASEVVSEVVKNPVTKLFVLHDRLWLVGEPGSGKTTCLQMSVLSEAERILNTGFIDNNRIPVYIPVKVLIGDRSLAKFIADALKVAGEELDKVFIYGRVRLVLDGLNEVSENIQIKVQNEVSALLNEYEDISINISSRRYGFTKTLRFTTFELLPLTFEQIEEYIRKYVRSADDANNLYNQLRLGDELVLDFARNPLLLKMLIQVGIKENIQPNFGLLFQKFIAWLLEREKKKGAQLDFSLKERILAELAFKMRLKLVRSIEYDDALYIVDQVLEKLRERVGAISFLDEVLDNRILIKDSDKQLSFFHELVLEYYTAVKLLSLYKYEPKEALKFAKRPEWQESLLILSGILKKPDDLVIGLAETNIVLSARCIASGCKISEGTVHSVFNECQKRLLNESVDEFESITALMELSSNDSFRLVVKHLAMRKHSFTKALSRCQRPELVALKLLKFGLTGKNRIRQCLKVFVNRPNSRSFIDSDTIGQAQLILISGKIEIEDISLITSLGISEKAADRIKQRIESIISSGDINSAIFAKTCELISSYSSLGDLKQQILLKSEVQFKQYTSGQQLYHAYRILSVIRKYADVNDLVEVLCDKALSFGYFSLLHLYLKSFDIYKEKYINKVIPLIIAKVKLGSIIAFQSTFPGFVTDSDLIMIFRKRMSIGFIPEVFPLVEKIRHLLKPSDVVELVNSIIRSETRNLSASKLIAWISKLQLSDKFVDMAIITHVNHDKKSGFARDLIDGNSYYFNFRKQSVEPEMIRSKTIIQYRGVIELSNDREKEVQKQKWLRPRITSFSIASTAI